MDLPTKKMEGVAVIGMACRFPGAVTPVEFWENLRNGKESISLFTDSELVAAGVAPSLLASEQYVKAAPVLDGVDLFDADFFKYSPKEATALDPQQRFFLECAWEALENAGYDPANVPKRVGVYAGTLVNTYLLYRLTIEKMPLSLDFSSFLETLIASDKDFLATRASYKLNLKGPSLTVQTACSTGLVAVHLACQSLLNGECETALAGAVSIRFPHRAGYLYREGGMVSPDGHCRPFTDRSQGTVFGSGVGIVVLKRLEDAIADRDSIHAVIRGTAINNDGSSKMSYTAPSIDGHAEVVVEALEIAGVPSDTIGYVEAHGTATDVGDPVEIAALTQAFRETTGQKQFCAIGSVKSNIGHLDAAAGIAGLIKAVLAVEHGSIPPTLHFERPNPKIDLAASPFYVNTSNAAWKTTGVPRRAGISSLGVGGTNAHAVIEQAPVSRSVEDSAGKSHLLVLSARTTTALEAQISRYRTHLSGDFQGSIGEICYTAANGRHSFDQRVSVVAASAREAADQLARVSLTNRHAGDSPRVAFLFSGQGSQYPGMARRLYDEYPVFRESMETSQSLVRGQMEQPLLDIVLGADGGFLNQTRYTQPAVLAMDLALYDLWKSWGIEPAMVMGHSLGEYAAAVVAGVFRREDAFRVVCERARLMQDLSEGGAMAAVRAPAEWTLALAEEVPQLSIAALNAHDDVVISGKRDVVLDAARRLESKGGTYKLLPVSHAFHSALMDPILDRLQRVVSAVRLSPPGLPLVSNVTGRLAGPEITEPAYWRKQARLPVRFSDGIQAMYREGCRFFVECGPGSILLGMGANCIEQSAGWYPSIRKDGDKDGNGVRTILESLGHLYSSGITVDWNSFYKGRHYRRVPLPTYPFERKRYWPESSSEAAWKNWIYRIEWRAKAMPMPARGRDQVTRVVLKGDVSDFASHLQKTLSARGVEPSLVPMAEESRSTAVVYLAGEGGQEETAEVARIAADLAASGAGARLWIVTRGSQFLQGAVSETGLFQSSLWGLARGIEVEHPEIWGGVVDLDPKDSPPQSEMLASEILSGGGGTEQVAYRGFERFVCRLLKDAAPETATPLAIRGDGTYLITGGTGALGQAVAQWLIAKGARRLVLTSRSGVASESLANLRGKGAEILAEKVDVTNQPEMMGLFRSIQSSGTPLRGVFHLAGIVKYERIREMGRVSLKEVLQSKTEGARILHDLTKNLSLDFFVMFSSMSSLLPGVEMSAYAAANSFLDSLAHYRRSAGLPALTIDWGPWSGPGMGEARTSKTSRSGVALMDPGAALECMSSLMNANTPQVMVADIHWPVFRPLYESGRACSILEEMPLAASVTAGPAASEIARLRSAPRSQQRDLLEQYVRNQVLGILGIDRATGLDSGKRLFDAGLDSLRAVELRNRLQSDLECALPSTLTLNYPTIESIVGFLAETLPFLQKSSDRPTDDSRGIYPNAQDVAGLSEDEMRRIINEELAKVSQERMR